MTRQTPAYDPKLAAEQRAQRAYAALKDVLKFGTALILPNSEAGFVQGLVTNNKHTKPTETNEHH